MLQQMLRSRCPHLDAHLKEQPQALTVRHPSDRRLQLLRCIPLDTTLFLPSGQALRRSSMVEVWQSHNTHANLSQRQSCQAAVSCAVQAASPSPGAQPVLLVTAA